MKKFKAKQVLTGIGILSALLAMASGMFEQKNMEETIKDEVANEVGRQMKALNNDSGTDTATETAEQ